MVYQLTKKVEFNHVDPAGIVFYPRYFEMINSVVENYFMDHVGLTFGDMHLKQKMAVPTAHFDVNFHAPSHLEDILTFTLTVERIGNKSARFDITIDNPRGKAVTVKQTIVWLNLANGQSEPWPDRIAKKLKESL